MRHWITITLLVSSMAFTGCALLQSPTPRSNAKVQTSNLTTEQTRSGRLIERNSPSNVIELPEQWTAGNVALNFIEEWQDVGPDWAGDREPPIKRREVIIERVTDPTVAGEVAAIRAQGTADVSANLGNALMAAVAMGYLRTMERDEFREEQQTTRILAELQADIEKLKLAPVEAHHAEPETPPVSTPDPAQPERPAEPTP